MRASYEGQLTEKDKEIDGLRAEVFGLNDEKNKLEDALGKEIAKSPTNGVEITTERAWETAQEAYGLVKQGNYAEGIAKYTAAIESAPRDDSRFPRLYANRGVAYLKSQEYVKACADLREALKLDPKEPSIAFALEEATRLKLVSTKK